jgi:ribosomal protein S18 acetylase RimI-like enzyme
MKRLYVRPGFRGYGIGRSLVDRLIDHAKQQGFTSMCLDTVPGVMDRAIHLYRTMGYRDIPPYMDDPVPGAICLELALR